MAGWLDPKSHGEWCYIQLLAITRGVPQGSFTTEVSSVYIFLEEDNECPLSNFADDSELDRNAGVLDGAMALQRVWDRLGGWSEANCMKFKKVKWCLLHFGPCSATGWGKSGSKASREGSWASGQQPR